MSTSATETNPWREYRRSTVTADLKVCGGCGDRTTQPGRDGFHWRFKPSRQDSVRMLGRETEVICGRCLRAESHSAIFQS
jgi:hypothetical protein